MISSLACILILKFDGARQDYCNDSTDQTTKLFSQTEADSGSGRRSYELLSKPVGLECLTCILGIGKKRLLKAQRGLRSPSSLLTIMTSFVCLGD